MNFKNLKLLLSAPLLIASMSANALTVDLFDTDQAYTKDAIGDATSVSTTATSLLGDILGDEREIHATKTNNWADGALGVSGIVTGGLLAISTDSGVDGNVAIQYDGSADSGAIGLDLTAGLGGEDFSIFSNFVFEVISADVGFSFSIGMYSDAANYSVITLLSSGATGPNLIPLAGFGSDAACSAALPPGVVDVTCGSGDTQASDLSSINAFEIIFYGVEGVEVDMRLNDITTIPEPSVLSLLGLGLIGVGVVGYRRRRGLKA